MQSIDRQQPKPRRSRRRGWIILAIVGAVLAFSCIACTMFVSLLPNPPVQATRTHPTGAATTQLSETPLATPASSARSVRTQTNGSEPTSTSTPEKPTHGKPTIGGLYSDFLGKYGPPFQPGSDGSEDFWADQAQMTLLNVTAHDGKVVTLDIAGPDSWGKQQTQTYCEQFLPTGASEFNSVGGTIDFQSSNSTIVLVIYEQGACSLSIAE